MTKILVFHLSEREVIVFAGVPVDLDVAAYYGSLS